MKYSAFSKCSCICKQIPAHGRGSLGMDVRWLHRKPQNISCYPQRQSPDIRRCLLVYGVIPVVCRRLPCGFMQVFKVCDEFEPKRRNLRLSRVGVATIRVHIKTNCVIIAVLSCDYIYDAHEPIFHIKVKLTARTSSGRRRMCCHGHRPSQHRECDLCVIRAAVRV